MSPKIVQQTIKKFGLDYSDVGPMQGGYRSSVYPIDLVDNTKVILLFFKSEPNILNKIKTANRLSNFLSDNGFPARRTVDDRIIEIKSKTSSTYACLYNYLPGSTIAWEAYTMDHIKAVGKTMAKMHSHAKNLPKQVAPNIVDVNRALNVTMTKYFNDLNVANAIKTKLKLKINFQIFKDFENLVTKNDAQLLHMDFVRGNILFNDRTEITGIIDFEKASFGNPIYDIARTLAFLLVDCKYKQPEKVYKYFIESGYKKYGGGSVESAQLLDGLLGFYLVHDFYKFLRHNPYEFLKQNEHFIRTRDILVQRKILINL